MRTFSNSDQKTFESLAKLSQLALKRVVTTYLIKHYKKVVQTEDYVYAEGSIPIALVAHLDTVFDIPPEEIYFDPQKNVMWSPDGLGADDRAGVFAILQILRSGLRPHVIFTTDEEIGGVGAQALSLLDCPFSKLNYMIQLDRRGSNDAVFYDCESPEFTEYIESFGFTWNWGTFSDISTLCPAWGVAGVNLSVGYRDEHTTNEVLFVGQLMATIEKVKKMLTQQDIPHFKYVLSPYAYSWNTKVYNNYGHQYNGGVLKCHHCGKYHMAVDMIPVLMVDNSMKYYCTDCIVDNVSWCKVCGEAIQKPTHNTPDEIVCDYCKVVKERNIGGHDPRAV